VLTAELRNITVTADAAMLSSKNIEVLESLGYHYVIGSKLAKTPYEIEVCLTGNEILADEQIFESQKTVTVNGKQVKRREIFQYRQKRASLDLLNIDKLLIKAQRIIEKKADIKRNRFLKITGAKMEINTPLVEEARRRAGIKGYLTDLAIPAQQVVNAYHQLFRVEKAFRMSKSDLKARPIFHHKRDSIEAHLTIVFAALAIAHYVETKTRVSIKKFIRTLEPIRTGIILMGNKTFGLEPEIPTEAMVLLEKLSEV
jgi:transposase